MYNMRTATSPTAYLQEELSRARLCVDSLKNYVVKAIELVNASSKRDHLHGVAGDIIQMIPRVVAELEASLNAAAFATSKLDYESLRQVIRPDKVDELERILDDVRLKLPRRTGR